jgi:hypothetical protein
VAAALKATLDTNAAGPGGLYATVTGDAARDALKPSLEQGLKEHYKSKA